MKAASSLQNQRIRLNIKMSIVRLHTVNYSNDRENTTFIEMVDR